jgi:hypothetical protein
VKENARVSKHEICSYQDAEGRLWQNRNVVLGSITAAAILVTALVGSTMEAPKPSVELANEFATSEISASARGSDTAFALMSTASKNLPTESWEPAF